MAGIAKVFVGEVVEQGICGKQCCVNWFYLVARSRKYFFGGKFTLQD